MMKEKIKKIIFGYFPGFVLGVITAISISVIAATYFPSNDVTYDNKESGLSSTDVQGAIDELYGICTAKPPAGNQIIEDNGLEKDPYECRYFFTGANPNNYVTFNNEEAEWRIISVECDGTIKIVRNNSIGELTYDSSIYGGNTNWARPADLNLYLNETYYNTLSETSQHQISNHNFSIGTVIENNNNLENEINNENSKTWNGKIALPTVSEYIRSNSNKQQCSTIKLNNDYYSLCKTTNWMNNSNINVWWNLSPSNGYTDIIFDISNNGYISGFGLTADSVAHVRPTLYLSSSVQIIGGDGTESNPYTIK